MAKKVSINKTLTWANNKFALSKGLGDIQIPYTSFNLLSQQQKDNAVLQRIKADYLKGADPFSLLSYIPRISVTQLAKDPKGYLKMKKNVIVNVTKGRTKQFVLNMMKDMINGSPRLQVSESQVKAWNENLTTMVEESKKIVSSDVVAAPSTPNLSQFNNDPVYDYMQLSATIDGNVVKFIDGHAIVQISRRKNIIMTQVQGRDLTRKEYISAGDYEISVAGKIVSPYPDVYPIEEVMNLRKLLEHNDLINCVSPLLNIFEVPSILITSYNIPQKQGYSNVQEYSFNAVFEKSVEKLNYEARELDKLNAAKAAMQKVIEERNAALDGSKDTSGNITVKALLTKTDPLTFIQSQKWI